ncbi:hypothetical protein NMG60_11024669 [Bertholletia excelsa]
MDHPLFGSFWNQPSLPRHSPAVRGIPVHPLQRKATETTETTPSRKVVSIPVHFVESEVKKSASALKIQKAFRGFLVRKSMKCIASIKREVEEIELKLSQSDTVELIWKDAKERLRVNETLMALLFKLDSIRGFDSGVRDCRKTVIKKAIALQERVDEIVSVNRAENTVDRTLDVRGSAEKEAICVSQTIEVKDSAEEEVNSANRTLEDEGEVANSGDCANKVSKIAAEVDGSTVSDNAVEEAVSVNENNCSEKIVHCLGALAPVSIDSESDQVPKIGDLEGTTTELYEKMDVSEHACVVKQVVGDPNNETLPTSEQVEENDETIPKEHSPNPQSVIEELGEEENMITEGRDDNKCNRELLGRMMEDNEKMMNMMRQLYERNERQTRMLNSLTQRVEQMEKAFICDKLRRKKKRQSTGTMDGSESTPDQKKCGKN